MAPWSDRQKAAARTHMTVVFSLAIIQAISLTEKTIYFVAGLPRSGSTLLTKILAQNPGFCVTPTPGIIDMLVQVRNGWDRNDVYRAMERNRSESAAHFWRAYPKKDMPEFSGIS